MTFFKIIHQDKKTRARAGLIQTAHGNLETPMIMTVGTKGTVKGITTAQLKEIGVPVVLANTYHLYLSPGNDLIRQAGGLHKFMNWDGPMFTDSGGFQIFSMGHGTVAEEIKGVGRNGSKTLLKLTEEGATFRSYIDGSIHLLTPEKAIQIQYDLGADMIAVLDECTPMHVSKRYTEKSMEMTHRWLLRCKDEHKRLQGTPQNNHNPYHESFSDSNSHNLSQNGTDLDSSDNPVLKYGVIREESKLRSDATSRISTPQHPYLQNSVSRSSLLQSKQALYGIIQGGVYNDLRKISTEFIAKNDMDGICIGGCLGKDKDEMDTTIRMTVDLLPKEKPVHLLGIGGDLEDLVRGVEQGMDTFDCVAHTRNARHGLLYSSGGKNYKLSIRRNEYRKDFSPIDANCDCYVCKNYSKAYLAYLIRAKETMGGQLCSYHNIYFITNFMKKMREAILDDRFSEFKKTFFEGEFKLNK